MDKLQSSSKNWMYAITARNAEADWLKLSVAVLLCKVAECELQNKLIIPFKEKSLNNGKHFNDDSKIYALSKYMCGVHAPTLGGIERALREAGYPQRPEDSNLLKEWRLFLRKLDWTHSSLLRNRTFLEKLKKLVWLRNRIAHTSEPTENEYSELIDFFIEDEKPGLFFRAIGISV